MVNGTPETTDTKDLQNRINELASVETLPEGLSSELVLAITAEKRRRETQASYTKGQQELKSLQATIQALQDDLMSVVSDSVTGLSDERKAELDTLKVLNPEQWRVEMNKLEAEVTASKQQRLAKVAEEASTKARQEYELSLRQEVSKQFADTHNGWLLTDDIFDNDIPMRMKNELSSGVLTYEQFLTKAYSFLNNTSIKTGHTVLDNPLKNAGGSSNSTESKYSATDYSSQIL